MSGGDALTGVGPGDEAERGRLYSASEALGRVRAGSNTMSVVMSVRGGTRCEVEAGCAGTATGKGADCRRDVD